MDKQADRETKTLAPACASSRPRTLAQAVEAYSQRLVRLGAEIIAITPVASADLPGVTF